jgi:hypothetical protein
MVAHTCDPNYEGGIPRAKMHDTFLKIIKVQRHMTQVIEHLPGKHEALSSNPSMAKKINKKQIHKLG